MQEKREVVWLVSYIIFLVTASLLSLLVVAELFFSCSFAGTFSEKVTRTVRQISPHLAAKMRPPHA